MEVAVVKLLTNNLSVLLYSIVTGPNFALRPFVEFTFELDTAAEEGMLRSTTFIIKFVLNPWRKSNQKSCFDVKLSVLKICLVLSSHIVSSLFSVAMSVAILHFLELI